jgi:hypothetical protein
MAILLSLLKSYGGYLVIAAAAGGWFLWHDHQEIDKGEARVVAAQKAADVKEAAHVAKVEQDATATIKDLQARLAGALAAPAPAPTVVVRMRLIPASVSAGTGSDDRPAVAGGDGSAGSSGAVGGDDQDIAGPTEQILKDDRAIIEYLQGYIATCQQAGVCRK